MIIYKENGACLFYHPFKEDEIQSDLISGFISAMSSMYGEFTGDGTRETIQSLKYQGMTLNGFNGKHVVGILISEGTMSTTFNLNEFIESFELRYEDSLKDWMGVIDFFEPDWIVEHLYTSLSYSSNLPFTVFPEKSKKQYSKAVVFLNSRIDSSGRFLFREVLLGLKKFLKISEAYTLDLLMRMKNDHVIAPISIEAILESTIHNGELLESFSTDGDVAAKVEDSMVYTGKSVDKIETASEEGVIVTDDGMYSLEKEVSLGDLIQTDGDGWLRDIASEAVTLYLGQWVVVNNPEYVPVGYDSNKGTVRIRITWNLKDHEDE